MQSDFCLRMREVSAVFQAFLIFFENNVNKSFFFLVFFGTRRSALDSSSTFCFVIHELSLPQVHTGVQTQ